MTTGSTITFSSQEVGIIIIKASFDAPFVQFSYQNIQIMNNAEYVGILIGCSIGLFLILLIVVIFISRCMIRNHLRAMQSPNIVYFLKKKVLQYLRGVGNEDEAKNFMPPPPRPPSYPRAMPIAPPPERRFTPYQE
jgi:hypothetical protein